jgi:hypothetical protein
MLVPNCASTPATLCISAEKAVITLRACSAAYQLPESTPKPTLLRLFRFDADYPSSEILLCVLVDLVELVQSRIYNVVAEKYQL